MHAEWCCFPRCRFQKYGGLFRTYVLFNPMVVVTDETEVRRLLQVRRNTETMRCVACSPLS